ncbi:MAG: excinuclease ABC subunit UvrC [Candidatus Omnitrophota bacterium]
MVNFHNAIIKKVKELPGCPGIYKFLDKKGKVIYVGKAINLRKRVSSYFRKGKVFDSRLSLLVSEIKGIDIVKASSEAEALIYEAGLIKDLSPRFNVELKDDKSYPFLKLTVNEKYPRLFITRRKVNDGALYYGPYTDSKLLKEALVFMKKVFLLRSCRVLKKKICLEYHIGQCSAPCEKKISKEEYGLITARIRRFLEGKKDELVNGLEDDMKRYSENRQYEKALEAKNALKALTAVRQYHDMASHPVYGELDELRSVLGLEAEPDVIECFDVSNISGMYAVGAMVSFVSGKPSKSGYRKFRIKSVSGIDDYSMIREIVTRRYARLIKEKKPLPDIVMIDGGRGHLSVVEKVMEELGIKGVKLVAIAKEHNHLYVQGRRLPIRLSPGSGVLFLIQRIRDEAHRFAITYHRHLRSKQVG